MKPSLLRCFFAACFSRVLQTSLSTLVAAGVLAADPPRVELARTPNGGIQPQAAMDDRGTIHLVYYKGEASAGNLFYVRREADSPAWSAPLAVNTQPGSAMAAGTIRGAQMVLGRERRVLVAWNGSQNSESHKGPAMWYTRMNDAGTAFEPQRDLITVAAGLDGGGSVAADANGNVTVTWHATVPGAGEGEDNRAVFISRSVDDGRTFARERRAFSEPTGACGCCGMKAFADRQGSVYVLYRAATQNVNRDEILLASRNGSDFQKVLSHPWKIAACPMSSAAFTQTKDSVLAAWESESEVYLAAVDPKTFTATKTVSPSVVAKKKHPVIATNGKGETLLAWTEGTAWKKGGAVAWQVFDAQYQPTATTGREDGVPVWSLAAAVARPDGAFMIIY